MTRWGTNGGCHGIREGGPKVKDTARHYERAFDHYLRSRRVAFVRVDEARRQLLPIDAPSTANLKFFDYVVYGQSANLLVELKGRRLASPRSTAKSDTPTNTPTSAPRPASRLECWVTQDDLGSLQRWEMLFGPPFEALIVFAYWCSTEPPASLFQEVFEFEGRWYALRAVRVQDYLGAMRTRSPRWRTVDMPQADFERISQRFAPEGAGDLAGG